MATKVYSIRALSNMHVGSGDNNYGVIDKLVQRDVVTNLPTIHSSSLKGALCEFFKNKYGKESDKVKNIFGGEKSKGSYDFFEADLVSIPVRSNKAQYFNAFSPHFLKQVFEKINALGFKYDLGNLPEPEKGKPICLNDKFEGAIVEEQEWKCVKLPQGQIVDSIKLKFLGDNIVFMHADDFKSVCEKLPVIARNCLENGQSTNLWYEEVLPRESRFLTVVRTNGLLETEFDSILNEIVQIGANATIGYGYCKFSTL